jgi:hypothetical protein
MSTRAVEPDRLLNVLFNLILNDKDLLRRCVNNIKMDHREIGWDGADWMDMAQDRDQWRALVNTVLNLRVP